MPEPRWVWDRSLQRYRDLSTGRFVSASQVLVWAEQSLDMTGDVVAGLSGMLATDQLALQEWQVLMRDAIKDEYIRQYVAGVGGLEQMTQEDWGRIGGLLAKQYRYLDGFAARIADGQYSVAQIEMISRMYIESATTAWEYARGVSQGVPFDRLPAMPADGSTICMTRDRCHWEYEYVGPGLWHCYWRLDPMAEHCETCLDRADEWAPYVIDLFEGEDFLGMYPGE